MKTNVNNGYEYTYMPEHPNANSNGCVSVHRYLMSQKIGRPLRKDEDVHHIDGNKLNNNMDNLELLQETVHLHRHFRERIKHPCKICGKITINKQYCSNECNSLSQRKCKRPSIELLHKLTEEYPFTHVGKMFGVSDNAIRKWMGLKK